MTIYRSDGNVVTLSLIPVNMFNFINITIQDKLPANRLPSTHYIVHHNINHLWLINALPSLGRMGLLVTLFLVLANMFNSINNTAPTAEGSVNIETSCSCPLPKFTWIFNLSNQIFWMLDCLTCKVLQHYGGGNFVKPPICIP